MAQTSQCKRRYNLFNRNGLDDRDVTFSHISLFNFVWRVLRGFHPVERDVTNSHISLFNFTCGYRYLFLSKIDL
jgi:hypothetical protein